ncbi:MAG: M48 family metallopeptidase [Campylobacterota bacterium]
MPTKTLTTDHGQIPYSVEKKPRNRHTYLRIRNDRVEIKANAWTTQQMIENLLHKNAAQIMTRLQREKKYFYLGQECTEALDTEFYTHAGRKYLPARTQELAQTTGLLPQAVKVTKAKTRWGSCSGKNNINLSCYLMKLPKEVIDYVIIHELCHIVHKNHSKRFWREVAKHEPLFRQKIATLRRIEAQSV